MKSSSMTMLLLLAVPLPAPAQNAAAARAGNPFARFFGEWTLKGDRFQQVWDGKTVETLSIPRHHTKCAAVNTDRSVLCVVNTPDLKGHILWTYDDARKQVHHLSHFGQARTGFETGQLNDRSDLHLTLHFQDEPEGSYRIYDYRWVSNDEYAMMSRQFDRDGKPTGNWYGGSFVRIAPPRLPDATALFPESGRQPAELIHRRGASKSPAQCLNRP